MSQPLRSISITETSTLLRVGPPLCSALVLSRLWDLHLCFSLNIGTTASHVPYKSQNQGHAIFMPDAAQTVSRLPLDLSWNSASTPVLTSSQIFRHLSNGSLDPYLIPSGGTFSSTLTTMAFGHSSLRWFEACSCKPAPRGPDSPIKYYLRSDSAFFYHM